MCATVAPEHPPGRSLGRSLLALADGISGAVLGFLFYGAWAVWANADHGLIVAGRSGLLQGTMSFIVTLSGTTTMKTLFRGESALWWRFSRACLGTLALIYSAIIAAHVLNGTPHILLTLAPGLPITIIFCLSFCYGLVRYTSPGAIAPAATVPTESRP